jgi:hypothetical protein
MNCQSKTTDISTTNDQRDDESQLGTVKLENLEGVLSGGDSDRFTCKATLNLEIKVYSSTSYSE